jgi:hypothetical protein
VAEARGTSECPRNTYPSKNTNANRGNAWPTVPRRGAEATTARGTYHLGTRVLRGNKDAQFYLEPLPGSAALVPLESADLQLAKDLAVKLRNLRASTRLVELRAAMSALRLALDPPFQMWDAMLVRLLESHAHRVAETRLRKNAGTYDPDAADAQLRNAVEALEFLRRNAAPGPPRWLSAKVIETMMEQVTLGGRGRGRSRSPMAVVDLAKDRYKRGATKKPTKKGG